MAAVVPPGLVRVRIHERGRRINLWLPVFLLWPVIGLAGAILLPLLLLAYLLTIPFRRGRALIAAPWRLYQLACSSRGLEVNVEKPGETIYISIR